MSCSHPDVQKFEGVRCCLACGEAVFEEPPQPRALHARAGTEHQYRNLNYALGQEIRVIDLLPGAPSDGLRCKLIHVNLEDNPAFEAVSYTWATEEGDDSLTKTIRVSDGTSIKITVNCEAVLRGLRKCGLSRRLWLDAICIDQSNTTERNHQVGLMNHIYTRAWRVMVCMDDHTAKLGSKAVTSERYSELFKWLRRDDNSRPGDQIALTLHHMMRLRYFRRVWVIQEVALAKAVYLRVNNQEIHVTSAILQRIRRENSQQGVLDWDISREPVADIVTCLRLSWNCDCSDLRDRVFGMLSLMEPVARSLIPVDYTLAVDTIHSHALLAAVQSQGALEVLRYVNLEEGFSSQRLHTFLDNNNNNDTSRRSLQCELKTVGSARWWRSKVIVHVQPSLEPIESREAHDVSEAIFQRPADDTVVHGLLPRFQVRAHYIDCIVPLELGKYCQCRGDRSTGPSNRSVGGDTTSFLKATFRTKKRTKTGSLVKRRCVRCSGAKILMPSRESTYSSRMRGSRWYRDGDELYDITKLAPIFEKTPGCTNSISVIEELRRGTLYRHMDSEQLQQSLDCLNEEANLEDVLAFERVLEEQHKENDEALMIGEEEPMVFFTHNSIGLSKAKFGKGDLVFAVDGVKTTLILRKNGPQQYKIVGECYLWAAFELDYWNAESKKGRRRTRPYDHDYNQTQIIEIC